MDPSGNRTILVESPIPVEEQPEIAADLMKLESDAEQVGFVSAVAETAPSLRMAGGEFCGNASLCAGVLFCVRRGLAEQTLSLAVSGSREPVRLSVRKTGERVWRGSVSMPRPLSIGEYRFSDNVSAPLVSFPGISIAVFETELEPKTAEKVILEACRDLKLPAMGLMFLNSEDTAMTPLVYVPAAGTLVWENACGSGTAAVGAYLAKIRGKRTELSLRQPGGVLEICADPDGELTLSGSVRILRESHARIVSCGRGSFSGRQ